MKATYSSDRNGASIIEINFKDSEYKAAEKVGQYLVDVEGFEWVHEEDGRFTVGCFGYTVKELKLLWSQAKKEVTK